jgi:hypothetical protein
MLGSEFPRDQVRTEQDATLAMRTIVERPVVSPDAARPAAYLVVLLAASGGLVRVRNVV